MRKRIQLKVPADYITASDTTLPNGLRLIVKTDPTSPTVSVLGSVKHNSDLQTPAGQEGVSDLLDRLFSYGTHTLDQLAFQKALDDSPPNNLLTIPRDLPAATVSQYLPK